MDGSDDLVRIGGPDERLRVAVCLGEVAVDGGLEVDDGAEDATLQGSFGEGCEEGLDCIQPGAGCRSEVEGPARVPGEPSQDLRLLMSGIVVQNDMDGLADRYRRLDRVEEANELLVPMALHAAANDGAVEHVEGGEEGRRACRL